VDVLVGTRVVHAWVYVEVLLLWFRHSPERRASELVVEVGCFICCLVLRQKLLISLDRFESLLMRVLGLHDLENVVAWRTLREVDCFDPLADVLSQEGCLHMLERLHLLLCCFLKRRISTFRASCIGVIICLDLALANQAALQRTRPATQIKTINRQNGRATYESPI